jgi:hypothetical protein
MKKTLFTDPSFFVDMFLRFFNFQLSIEFITIADIQLSSQFEVLTGIRINPVRTSFIYPEENSFKFTSGKTSELNFRLYINHNWNDCPIQWISKSNKVYMPNDTEIDPNDIVFSFKYLDIKLIHQQMYPLYRHPFQSKKRSFELVVERIDKDCIIEMELKPDHNNLEEIQHLVDKINDFFTRFNMASEKADRRDGVLYTWRHEINEWGISWQIDLGSVDYSFFNKMLDFVSKIGVVEKIRFI